MNNHTFVRRFSAFLRMRLESGAPPAIGAGGS
jgi:hypothetical protein